MDKMAENKGMKPPVSWENNSISEVSELTLTLQRVQADFENYRKRTQNEMNVHYLRGKATVLKEMLSFVDTLDAAIRAEKSGTRNALENMRAHFLQTLSKEGVKPIHTIGKPFDPFTSECMLQGNDAQQEDDIVLEELQRGYYFHDDVLRAAKVKVNKKNDDQHVQLEGGTNHE